MKNKKGHINIEGMEKKNIFSVPEGYFESLSENVAKKTTESSLEKEKLKDNIYATPERYFNELPSLIERKIAAGQKDKNLLRIFIRVAIPVAIASIAMLFLIPDKNENRTTDKTKHAIAETLSPAFKFVPQARESIKIASANVSVKKILASVTQKDILRYLEEEGGMEDYDIIDLAEKSSKTGEEIIHEEIKLNKKQKQEIRDELYELQINGFGEEDVL